MLQSAATGFINSWKGSFGFEDALVKRLLHNRGRNSIHKFDPIFPVDVFRASHLFYAFIYDLSNSFRFFFRRRYLAVIIADALNISAIRRE